MVIYIDISRLERITTHITTNFQMVRRKRMYTERCSEKLKAMGAPLVGWYCEDVIDWGEATFTCELCGYKNVPEIWREIFSPPKFVTRRPELKADARKTF